MGADVMAPPTPLSKELQTEDDRGEEQHVVVDVDETPSKDYVQTPVQHDEDVTTQRPDVKVRAHNDQPVRKKAPSTRYPSETYDLLSARMRSRKSIRRAK